MKRVLVVILLSLGVLKYCSRDTEVKFSAPEPRNDTAWLISMLETAGVKYARVVVAQQRIELGDVVVGLEESEIARWRRIYSLYSEAIAQYADSQRVWLAHRPYVNTEEKYVQMLDSFYRSPGAFTDSLYGQRVRVQLRKMKLVGE